VTAPRSLSPGQTLGSDTPDRQWQREQRTVIQALGGAKLMILRGWPVEAVKGGIVFTHPNARLNIDDSCQVAWGSSTVWSNKIHAAPQEPSFSTELQLRTVDALLESSLRLHTPSVKPKSAVTLANSLDQG
jgi:hypothetical protein